MSIVRKYVLEDKNEFFAETEGIEQKIKVRKDKQNSAYLQWLHAFARIQSWTRRTDRKKQRKCNREIIECGLTFKAGNVDSRCDVCAPHTLWWQEGEGMQRRDVMRWFGNGGLQTPKAHNSGGRHKMGPFSPSCKVAGLNVDRNKRLRSEVRSFHGAMPVRAVGYLASSRFSLPLETV